MATRQASASDMGRSLYFCINRSTEGPFDLVHAGLLSGDRVRDAESAASYADAGVTWWLEHIYPGRMSLDEIRDFIRLGPPRTG